MYMYIYITLVTLAIGVHAMHSQTSLICVNVVTHLQYLLGVWSHDAARHSSGPWAVEQVNF